MTSEIITELKDNYVEIKDLIKRQKFTVWDAERYMDRYFNVIRKVEQLEKSRDMWKEKYDRVVEDGTKC